MKGGESYGCKEEYGGYSCIYRQKCSPVRDFSGKLGKELKSQDELAVMDGGKCILQVRGVRPFFSDKFDITRNKQYPMLLDDNPEMGFNIEKYVSDQSAMRLKLSSKDRFMGYEVDVTAGKEVTNPEEAEKKEIYIGLSGSEETE